MNRLLIITLLLSGLCSLSSSVPRQFHVVKEQKTWTEAQQYCREEFTDLATIDNMAEMETVKSIINEIGAGHGWIGLKQTSSLTWQWSLASKEFYKENEAEFRNWGDKQPNGSLGQEDCVFMGANGKWNNANRREMFHFICYDGKNSVQPYVLVKMKKTWADAQRYCREKHTDLASVRNQEENYQIQEISRKSHTWIGLFRDAWKWSDGSSSSFRHWFKGEPNFPGVENCTQFYADKGWYNVKCTKSAPFICYRGLKRQIVRVRFQVDSRMNLSDPAVQKAFLQQIQQRLQGMPADAKLTWRRHSDGEIFHEKREEERRKLKQNEI